MSSDDRYAFLTELQESISYSSDTSVTSDGASGPSQYFITGICMQTELLNRNGRWYKREAVAEAVEKYRADKISRGNAYGELNHPEGPTINQDRVSHIIKELWWDGNNVLMKAKVIDTPMGRIVKTLIDEGATIGVSCRGLGVVKEEKSRKLVTKFHIATAADIVSDPSAPDAFMRIVMEDRYRLVDGQWTVEQADKVKEAIDSASKVDREAVAIKCFEHFLANLR